MMIDYSNYIKPNKIATAVKMADLEDLKMRNRKSKLIKYFTNALIMIGFSLVFAVSVLGGVG